MSKVFITFGGGSLNYIQAGYRLKTQIKNLNLFDKAFLYTDINLKKDDEFWNTHSNFINTNNRGHGYWLWKPYLIKKTMEKMNDGDILLYLDSGCEVDIKKKQIISDYFEIVKNNYIIGSPYSSSGSLIETERRRTKMDLFIQLDMLDDKYVNTPQHEAGALLFYVCDKTRDLINEWYKLSCNYHLIDDSLSINKNLNGFIEHRHDQSIFSLLSKKYNLFSRYDIRSCVEYIRNRNGNSKLH